MSTEHGSTEFPYDEAEAEQMAVEEATQADDAIVDFWEMARGKAHLGDATAVFGQGQLASVPPPVWAFGETPHEADEILALVLDGTKTATTSAVAEYEAADEELPVVGDLAIVVDGNGNPRALLRTTDVSVVALGAVDEAYVVAEAEDGGDLSVWRQRHEEYYGEEFDGVGDDFPLVLERFEVVYP